MKTSQNRRLNLWGVADAGGGFISIVSSTYLAIFLTDVALLPLGAVSVVMLITSVFDFFISATAGGIIATIKPMKWGKLRSWLLVCPPITAVFFIIHFITVPNNVALSATIITLGFIMAKTSFNFSYTADLSLIGVIGHTQDERNKLSAQRMAGSNLGRLAGNYLAPVIIAFLAPRLTERFAYPVLMIFLGVIFIITNLIHFNIAGNYENQNTTAEMIDKDRLTLKDIYKSLSTNYHLLVTLLIDLTSNMAALALPALSVYYYKYVAEAPGMVPTHMLLIGLAGFGGSMLVRAFGSKVKDVKNYLCIAYLIIAACLFSTRFVAYDPYVFMAFNVVLHLVTGTTQPFELSLYMDNVVYNKWKNGVDANSLIMGMASLPVRFASILKSILIPFALMSAGYVAGIKPTPEIKQAIVNAYSLIPAVIPVIGFVMLKFMYKLSAERVEKMKAEIAQ